MSNNTNEPLFAEERKRKIIEMLRQKNKIMVPELCEYFNVSGATIRNDLRDLEKSGMLKRTHGGAINVSKSGFEPNYYQKEVKYPLAKKAIAEKGVELIEDGDVIILDTGTTILKLAQLLKNKKNLTVVVNDIEIARCLEEAEGVNIIMIGGTLRKNLHCTVGPIAASTLSGLNVDKAFMATNGLSIEKGLTTPDINQAEIKKIMIDIASEVIVLCDSSKLGKNSFVQFAPLNRIDKLITNNGVNSEYIKELSGVDIDIVTVEAPDNID